MFNVTSYDQLPSWVVNYLEPALWWISVVLCGIAVGIFYQTLKKTEKTGRSFITGLLIFTVGFGLGRLFENIRKFIISVDRFDIVKGWVGLGNPVSGINLWLRVLYYVFSWSAIPILFYITEKEVFKNKTHFLFTASAIGEGIVSVALYFTLGTAHLIFQIFAIIGFFGAGVFPVVIYLSMGIKSTGVIRKSCFITVLGLIFFLLSVMAELPESLYVVYIVTGQFLDAWLVALVSPIGMCIGFSLLVVGYKKMFSGLF